MAVGAEVALRRPRGWWGVLGLSEPQMTLVELNRSVAAILLAASGSLTADELAYLRLVPVLHRCPDRSVNTPAAQYAVEQHVMAAAVTSDPSLEARLAALGWMPATPAKAFGIAREVHSAPSSYIGTPLSWRFPAIP